MRLGRCKSKATIEHLKAGKQAAINLENNIERHRLRMEKKLREMKMFARGGQE